MKMCNIHCVATPQMPSDVQKIWIGDRLHGETLRCGNRIKRLWF